MAMSSIFERFLLNGKIPELVVQSWVSDEYVLYEGNNKYIVTTEDLQKVLDTFDKTGAGYYNFVSKRNTHLPEWF